MLRQVTIQNDGVEQLEHGLLREGGEKALLESREDFFPRKGLHPSRVYLIHAALDFFLPLVPEVEPIETDHDRFRQLSPLARWKRKRILEELARIGHGGKCGRSA